MGRLVEIEADAGKLSLSLGSFRAAWRLLRRATQVLPLLKVLHDQQLGCQLRIGSAVFEVLPKPALAVRLLMPALNRIVSGSGKAL